MCGTAKGANLFPGAVVPFGMIQWSPDTELGMRKGGYAWPDKRISDFSVDHISGAGLTGASFVPPGGFDPVQHVARSLAAVPYAHEVEVVLATTLDDAKRRIPPTFGTLTETDGGVLFQARANDLKGAAVMLAGLGWPFSVRRPAALVTEVRALADRLRAWSE